LQDVDETNGCLSVAPGSHAGGLRKLRLIDPENENNNKQKMMTIADQIEISNLPKIKIPASLGDVLVFNTMLLHASGPNLSDRARFTLQVRFGNFLHPVAIEKAWPGSMRDGSVFHEKHPDYIVSRPL
jgi:ectoine hydroxylase-related dioxygenase (phytanoyl-CoA dioxygenase family)